MHDFDYQRRPRLTPNAAAERLREHGRPRDHVKVQERVQASLQMSPLRVLLWCSCWPGYVNGALFVDVR